MKTLHSYKLIASVILFFVAFSTNAQTTYNNNYQDLHFGGTGVTTTYFPQGSAGTEEGQVTLFEGVTILGGDTLDCYVVVEYVDGNISTIDKDATTGSANAIIESDFFAPSFSFGAGSAGQFGGEAVLSFHFIENGTFEYDSTTATYTATPVILENVQVNSYDLDGVGSRNSEQANEFTDFLISQVDDSTNLISSYDANTDSYRFTAGTYRNISDATDDKNRVRVLYRSASSISIRFLGSNSYYAFLDWGGGLSYTNQPSSFYNVMGMVYDDGDGVNDGGVDGTGIGSADGAPLYVSLADSNGVIIDAVAVAADGSFVLPSVPVADYTITVLDSMSTIGTSAVTSSLPVNWEAVGEQLGGTVDATADGTLVFDVRDLVTGGISLAIDQRPESDTVDIVIADPTLTDYMVLGHTPSETLSGPDLEEGVLEHGSTIHITKLPLYDQLFYNNTLIQYGQDGVNPPSFSNPFVIADYDTARLKVKFMNMTTNYLSFEYSLVDAAGLVDSTPAIYTITWPTILPVDFLEVRAELMNNDEVEVRWITASEHNNDYFVVERRMMNENEFVPVGEVKGAGNSTQILMYSFIDTDPAWTADAAMYRIKQVDHDGRYSYSSVAVVYNKDRVNMLAYPNPVVNELQLELDEHQVNLVRVVDMAGNVVYQQEAEGSLRIPTRDWATGYYVVQAVSRGRMHSTKVHVIH